MHLPTRDERVQHASCPRRLCIPFSGKESHYSNVELDRADSKMFMFVLVEDRRLGEPRNCALKLEIRHDTQEHVYKQKLKCKTYHSGLRCVHIPPRASQSPSPPPTQRRIAACRAAASWAVTRFFLVKLAQKFVGPVMRREYWGSGVEAGAW